MKKGLLSLFITLSIIMEMNAQEKTVKLATIKICQISGDYSKSINLDRNDTTYYVYLGFQNAKYSSITDIKSVFFANQEELNEFIKDLKVALQEMGTKVTMNWNRKLYTLDLYDFSKELYLGEKPSRGKGYTVIDRKGVEKLISWLETIQIGKD